MDFSARFLDVLKSVNYHLGHLPKDLFANEQRLPELAPVFAWFIDNVSPESNCVTPRELKLYASLSSKHDHFTSLEKVSKAIEKFYDESTIDSTVGPSDLDSLEKEIQKSQQELDDLNAHGILYQKKLHELDNDVYSLKEKYNSISTECYQMENNLHSVLTSLANDTVKFGASLKTLHDGLEDSMTNDDLNLPKLVSNNLLDLNKSYKEQICRVIQTWFKEENISSGTDIEKLKTVHTLTLIFESVTAMQQAEKNANCDVLKLNLALKNVSAIRNYYYNHKEILLPNGLDLSNYIQNIEENQEFPNFNNQQLNSNEYDDIKSRLCDLVVSDAEKKLSDLQITNDRITFVLDVVEHYIMMSDVVHCLLKINCSIANLKCELVLHCISFLEKMIDDISFTQNWVSNNTEADGQKTTAENTISLNSVVKFSEYSLKCIDFDEIDKLSKMVQQWKSKYHFSQVESNKLTVIQQKLQAYSDTINKLVTEH